MQTPGGHFIWHDLTTTDVAAAERFYGEVTPWTMKPWEDAKHYHVWMNGAAQVGGVFPLTNDGHRKPGWMPFVCVYDVDACSRQVSKLGGTVLSGPKEMPNVGAWAVIQDPTGAAIGMYEPTQAIPRNGEPRAGEFSWHELSTDDYKAAFDFYRQLFGWEKVDEHDMGAMGMYFLFGQKGRTYGGMFNHKPNVPGAPSWLSYVRVASAESAAATVRRLGGDVTAGPMEVPGGDRVAMCRDPQGAAFAVHEKAS